MGGFGERTRSPTNAPTRRSKADKIRELEAQLAGVREGRQLFHEETTRPEPKGFDFHSPVKRLYRGAGGAGGRTGAGAGSGGQEEDADLWSTEQELGCASQYVPLTSQPTMYSASSITYGSNSAAAHGSPMTVSSGLLQSNFGMTTLEKMGRKDVFENRREEALENFLVTFQMSMGEIGDE